MGGGGGESSVASLILKCHMTVHLFDRNSLEFCRERSSFCCDFILRAVALFGPCHLLEFTPARPHCDHFKD